MIQLFHAGTSHVYKGITCEMVTVDEYSFEHLLDDGWHFKPEDCYPETKPKSKPKETLKDKVEDAFEEVEEAQEALEKVQEALEEETPKAADSKVTVPGKSVLDKTLNAEKLGKTATKTAVKK